MKTIKKTLTVFLMLNLVFLAIAPFSFAAIPKNKIDKIVVEEYPLTEDLHELLKIAKKDVILSDGTKAIAKLNGKKIPAYTAIEKAKKMKDLKTGKISYIYRVTSFAGIPASNTNQDEVSANFIVDEKQRINYEVLGAVRALYEGEKTRDEVTFTRISAYHGLYDRQDTSVTIPFAVVFARARSETYDGDLVGGISGLKEEEAINVEGGWEVLLPSWSDEYLAETSAMGQGGGTFVQVQDGSTLNEFEVVLTYGTVVMDYSL